MVNISSASKKTLVFFLSLSFFCRAYAFVGTAGGWTLGDAVVQGATTTWNATKEVGGKIARGVASIKPTPAQVADGLKKAGIVGLGLTVTQELLDGVDFVMDPTNNSVRYKPNVSEFQYSVNHDVFFNTEQEACTYYFPQSGTTSNPNNLKNVFVENHKCMIWNDVQQQYNDVSIYSKQSTDYQEKTVKLDVLASQIINSAEAEDAEAKAYVSAVAQTALAEKEEDQIVPMSQLTQALDASQTLTDEDVKPVDTPTDTTSTDTPTDTTSPTDTKDLPAFCTWAPNACAWFTWTKEKYDTSVQAITDYFKEPELDNKDDELELEEPEKNDVDTNISFGGTCPVPLHVSVEIGGTNQDLELSFQPFCDLASFIKPIVILAASFSAALIIGGIRSSGDD